MTTVKILGQDEPTQVEKKKIEFVYYLDSSTLKAETILETQQPNNWKEIVLLGKNYGVIGEYDLMYATVHSLNKSATIICLGHFNDGIV